MCIRDSPTHYRSGTNHRYEIRRTLNYPQKNSRGRWLNGVTDAHDIFTFNGTRELGEHTRLGGPGETNSVIDLFLGDILSWVLLKRICYGSVTFSDHRWVVAVFKDFRKPKKKDKAEGEKEERPAADCLEQNLE